MRPMLEPLDPLLSSLVASERDSPLLAPAIEARLQQRVALSLATLAVPAAALVVAPAAHRTLLQVLSRARWPLHLVTVVASGFAGAGIHAVVTRPPRASMTVVAPAAVPTTAPAPVAAPVIVPAWQAPPRVHNARADAPTHDASLASERVLIDTARSALMRQRNEQALDALKRHVREFPQGRLSEERDSLRVQALANLGEVEEARVRAAQFEKTYPASLLRSMVEDAVEKNSDR